MAHDRSPKPLCLAAGTLARIRPLEPLPPQGASWWPTAPLLQAEISSAGAVAWDQGTF